MLGDEVRRERERLGLTVAEVARRANVDPVHLARFEQGEREMSSGRVDRVLSALGLKVHPNHDPSSADTAATS